MEHDLLTDMALCIAAAWLLAMAAHFLRQSPILAYLAGGFLIGPAGLAWVGRPESIETIAELGLLFLLFMIGLEIDLKKVLRLGRLIGITTLTQVGGGLIITGGAIAISDVIPASGSLPLLYLAFASALSSTVIIVKLLYDRRELDTLPGRITLGVLVLQDVLAILFLAVQPDLQNPALATVLRSLAKGAVLVVITLAASRFVLPSLFRSVAMVPELVLVGALAWCFSVVGLAAWLGLSREMGSLIAGVALSTFPYALDVTARITSLRDFFVTLFFVALGMRLPAPTTALLLGASSYALALVTSRALTVFPTLYRMRCGFRASLLPTIHLSQVSEFSLVILSLGIKHGHVGEELAGTVAYAFVLLAVLSSGAINHADLIVRGASPALRRLGLRDLDAERPPPRTTTGTQAPSIFLLGFSWTASSLLEEIRQHQDSWLDRITVIDFNPRVHDELRRRGVRVLYGDITQRETLAHAGVQDAQVIVCTLPNTVLRGGTNLSLLRQLREINPQAQIIVHSNLLAEVPLLYAAGASFVSLPRLTEASELRATIAAACQGTLADRRSNLETTLRDRNEVVP